MSRSRHRWQSHRRLLRFSSAAMAAAGLAVLSTGGAHAFAAAPLKYGWWSATNAGAPVAPPAPPDVPAKGMYVENGFSGATAVAALSFSIPTSASVGSLTLTTTGNPVINSAPVACPIAAGSANYQAAQNGAWAQRPSYDCAHAAKGSVSSDKKSVSFPVASLVHGGSLAVAIVATGTADRIPFQPPTASALTIGTQTPTTTGNSTSGSSGGGAYSQPSAGSKPRTAAAGAAAVAAAPPSTGDVTTTTTSDPGVPPAVAPSQQAGVAANGGNAAAAAGSGNGAGDASGGSGSGSGSNRAAAIIGLAAVIAALVFWAEGFGVLGGRVVTLAGRRQDPPYPAQPLTETATTSARS